MNRLTDTPAQEDKADPVDLDDLKGQRRDLDEQIEEAIRAEVESERAEEVESEVKAERELVEEEYRDLLQQFGGHQDCFFGAVVGRKLHPLCTCGWNEVATDLERHPAHRYG